MLEKIFELIKNNIFNPKMYVVIRSLILFVFLLFPYLDANLFYYKRVNSRVEILEKVSDIDVERITNEPILYKEYQDILQEISTQPDYSINHIFSKETEDKYNVAKFVSGGLIFWLISLMCLFIKGFKNIAIRIFGFVLFSVIGVVFGFVAKSIPNIFNHYVNCFGFPFVVLIIMIIVVSSGNKNNNKENGFDVEGYNNEQSVIGQDEVGNISVESAFLLVYAADGDGIIIKI